MGFWIWVVSVSLLAACGPRRVALPTDAGTPLADFAAVHSTISTACAGVRTLTAELGLSGRAGGERLRGRIVAGFARPASMRLEALAPLGPPLFVLAARDGSATLVFPRDSRILRDAPPEQILGALTGIALAPADLQAILTGCVVPSPRAVGGRVHGNGWASIDLDGGATLFLAPTAGQWQVRAAQRDGWRIEYSAWQGRFPRAVRLESASAAAVDATAAIAQLETNVDIDAAAFTVEAPPDPDPLTLDELRAAGPLKQE